MKSSSVVCCGGTSDRQAPLCRQSERALHNVKYRPPPREFLIAKEVVSLQASAPLIEAYAMNSKTCINLRLELVKKEHHRGGHVPNIRFYNNLL